MRQSNLTQTQSGATLIVALVMLLVMTSLGVTTMTSSTLQERIAGNSRQQLVARINAEFALKQAEEYLAGLVSGNAMLSTELDSFTSGGNGLYTPITLNGINNELNSAFDITNSTDWLSGSYSTATATLSDSTITQPQYIIEYIGNYRDPDSPITTPLNQQLNVESGPQQSIQPFLFRITAIGWGQDINASSVLQSYYVHQ